MKEKFDQTCAYIDEKKFDKVQEMLEKYQKLKLYQNEDDSLIHYGYFCDKETVQKLVSYGVDLNARDSTGSTILMSYSAQGNFEMVKFMLSHGADPNIITQGTRETALSWAVYNSQLDCAKVLYDNGADIFHILAKEPHRLDILQLSKQHSSVAVSEWLESLV